MAFLVSAEELSDEFSVFGIELDNQAIIEKLQELCTMYRLQAGDMVTEWIAFRMSRKNHGLYLEVLEQFDRERLSKRNQKNIKTLKKESVSTVHTIESLPMDVEGAEELYSAYGGTTPNSKIPTSSKRQHTPDNAAVKKFVGPNRSPAVPFSPASFSPASSTPAMKYNSRTNKGEIMVSIGTTSNVQWHGTGQGVSVEPYDLTLAITKGFKYMFQKLSAKRDVLNDIIEDAAEHLKQIYSIEEYSHVALPTQEEVTIVGRVCCDSNGKLNAESVVLEGSVDMSAGKTIPVDLSNLKEYAVFPGQIVALTGHNSTGQKFLATKLHESVCLPLPEIKDNTTAGSCCLSVMVAAGPYTTSDSLSYEPLTDLLEQIYNTRPDICILMGPFVDSRNSEIENSNLPCSFEELFQQQMERIIKVTENLDVKVVIMPSHRDIHHDPVYPTPPYRLDKHPKHVLFVSDPCTLRMNNIVFGLTSTDVLFALGSEEICYPRGSGDRLGRLTQHLLTQKSYYPLYPPSEEMCIDYVKYQLTCVMPTTPHILIAPSEFKQYIKEIKECCCINPGRLTKGFIGGSFAKIIIQANNVTSGQSIVKNVTAQVVRI